MADASIPLETIHTIRDECLCFSAQRAARVLARRFDRLFAPLGITNQQFSTLCALSGTWTPRMGELADFLGMDSTTMTAAAKALQRHGLIDLVPDPQDARARRPQLTPAAREVLARAIPMWKDEHGRLQQEVDGDARALAKTLSGLG